MKSTLIDNRHIRVFISSTFQDMQDERDYLMKRVFPELRLLAAERDVTLTELDLRWGITEEESKNGRVVEICLREIENSVPFFIGIVGNRYGWCPATDDLGKGVIEQFEKVQDYLNRHLSVTEMEMQFGVLERLEDMHAFFFINQNEIDENEIDYPDKLKKLKKAIKENHKIDGSSYPVYGYNTKEELGEQVKASFISLLNALYPDGSITQLDKDRIAQRSFKNQLCQTYIPNEHNFQVLNDWLHNKEEQYLVISGASGTGKSALIANFISALENKSENNFDVIYYFIGRGASEENYTHPLQFLCKEIRKRYNSYLPSIQNENDKLEFLFQRLATIPVQILIVLDAVNQISNEENAKLLNWIPIPPRNVKFLFSTVENDEALDVFKNREYHIFSIGLLNKTQRQALIKEYLGKFAKRLSDMQLERIVSCKLCSNALVLRTMLDELLTFGVYEKIDERISLYLDNKDIESFFDTVLSTYESEFGLNFVEFVFSLIAVSRNGLPEHAIMEIVGIKQVQWSQFYFALRRHLLNCNGNITFSHSYLQNTARNRYLKEDAEYNYRIKILDFYKDRRDSNALKEIPFQLLKIKAFEELYKFLSDLSNFYIIDNIDNLALYEYWKDLQNEDDKKYNLNIYLSSSREGLSNENLSEIFRYLGYFTNDQSNFDLALSFYNLALQYKEKNDSTSLDKDLAILYNNIATTMSNIGKKEKSIEYYKKSLKIRRDLYGDLHEDVATTYNNIAAVYLDVDLDKSIEYSMLSLSIRKKIFGENSIDVAISYSNLASAYGDKGKYSEAIKYSNRALSIQLRLTGKQNENIALCLANLGNYYHKTLDYENSRKHYLDALEIFKNIFTTNHIYIAMIYRSLGSLCADFCKFEDAMYYMKQSYAVFNNTKEKSKRHIKLFSDVCSDLGFMYYKQADFDNAISYYKRSISIAKENDFLKESSYDITLNNIARAYLGLGDTDKSLKYQQEALDIQLEQYGENHRDTARSYNNLGLVYLALHKYPIAYNYLIKALSLRNGLGQECFLDVADSYNNIGDLFFELKDAKNAYYNYLESYKIYSFVLSKPDPRCEKLEIRIEELRNRIMS